MTFAKRVGAKRTMLFHHDPLHTDGFLDDLHRSARKRWQDLGGDPEQIDIAAERAELTVGPAAPARTGRPASAGSRSDARPPFLIGLTKAPFRLVQAA